MPENFDSVAHLFKQSKTWKIEIKARQRAFVNYDAEKTPESPSDYKEIKPVNPKGNQSWIFIGRADAEAEAPVLRPLMWRPDSLEKTLMLGKIEGRRRGWQMLRSLDGITRLDRHEFERSPEDGEGQGSLGYCNP